MTRCDCVSSRWKVTRDSGTAVERSRCTCSGEMGPQNATLHGTPDASKTRVVLDMGNGTSAASSAFYHQDLPTHSYGQGLYVPAVAGHLSPCKLQARAKNINDTRVTRNARCR